jgi:tetratricopeptide (TPR) repeat protein
VCYLFLGDFAIALDYSNLLKECESDHLNYLYNIAVILQQIGNHGEAYLCFLKSDKLVPLTGHDMYHVAISCIELGHYYDALYYCDEAMKRGEKTATLGELICTALDGIVSLTHSWVK